MQSWRNGYAVTSIRRLRCRRRPGTALKIGGRRGAGAFAIALRPDRRWASRPSRSPRRPSSHLSGRAETAVEHVNACLLAVGRDGAFYREALELLDSAEEAALRAEDERRRAAAGFDAFVEEQCAKFYADGIGSPSLPPGRYFRMLLLGYFEGLESERAMAWRATDSLSLGQFVDIVLAEASTDHSTVSWTRRRIDIETLDPNTDQSP